MALTIGNGQHIDLIPFTFGYRSGDSGIETPTRQNDRFFLVLSEGKFN